MTNTERFLQKVSKLSLKADCLKYQDIPQWDSIGHISMIAALEDEFDIMMKMEDIIAFEKKFMNVSLLQITD
mgnify:CR=1 FL=1